MKLPQPFDIVWCYLPNRETPDRPGDKLRPVLVLAVQDGALLVTVAYGTSQAHAAPKVWEVTLQMDAKTPTTFDLSRIVTLPYRVEYFPRKPRKGAWPAMRKAELVAAIKAARR